MWEREARGAGAAMTCPGVHPRSPTLLGRTPAPPQKPRCPIGRGVDGQEMNGGTVAFTAVCKVNRSLRRWLSLYSSVKMVKGTERCVRSDD